MHADPITPGPWASHQWVPLFLAQLALSPDLPRACRAAHTSTEQVEAERVRSGYFDAACRIILREHRRRARKAGLPVPPVPRAPRFPAPATAPMPARLAAYQEWASHLVHRAEMDTLLLLITRVAEAAGVQELDDLPLVGWWSAERPKMLERHLLAIGDTQPALAEQLQSLLRVFLPKAEPAPRPRPPKH